MGDPPIPDDKSVKWRLLDHAIAQAQIGFADVIQEALKLLGNKEVFETRQANAKEPG